MNHIFFDTNVIQHTINNDNREKILDIHKSNIKFYNKSSTYLLPQVITELDEINLGYSEGIFSILKINKLDDFEEFNTQLIKNIGKHIFYPSSVSEIEKYKPYLKDAIYFLEHTYGNGKEYIEGITEMKTILGIKSSENYNNKDIGIALANLIENTSLGDETYNNFTYRDIYRCTGNFLYDYKNYLTKGENQKRKVGKDSLVFSEITFWINILGIDLEKDNIIFISSDYKFIKELIKFKNNIISGEININEYFVDLSPLFLSKLNEIFSKIKILKLNINDTLFENEDGSKNELIELL